MHMEDSTSYMRRPVFWNDVDRASWESWLWQQQNSVRSVDRLKDVLGAFGADGGKWDVANLVLTAERWVKNGFRFQVTPYVFSLVDWTLRVEEDPVWRQVFPLGDKARNEAAPDEYHVQNENWEDEAEMISPIAQHKYDNRIIVYTSDVCLGYCNYCFRSLLSSADAERHGGNLYWKMTMEEIAKRPLVEEVILSGGDPLIYNNEMLEKMLADLRSLKNVRAIRIHTRAWTHNPYRIDEEFCTLLKKYEVTVLGVHVVHPRELTAEFSEAVGRVRASGAKTLLMADIPLIKNINDRPEILRDLFMGLYVNGVKPYYLSHNMPNIPFAAEQRTTVRKGAELMAAIKRKISNGAMPEYIITHKSGKKTVPEELIGTADFVYTFKEEMAAGGGPMVVPGAPERGIQGSLGRGWPVIRFKNWQGKWMEYLDAAP